MSGRLSQIIWALLLLAPLLYTSVLGTSLLFVDSNSGPFLRSNQPETLSIEGFSATLSSLLGLPAPFAVDKGLSTQIDSVVQPDVFNRPTAVWSVNFAGLGQKENESLDAFAAKFGGDGAGALGLVNMGENDPTRVLIAVHAAAGQVPSPSQVVTLNIEGVPACSDECLDVALAFIAQKVNGEYKLSDRALHGSLLLRSFPDLKLDLTTPAVRLWAGELAGAWKSVEQNLQQEGAISGPFFLETTLMGLQLIRSEFGVDSEEYGFCLEFAGAVLGAVREALIEKFDGKVVSVVALLGDVDSESAVQQEGFVKAIQAHKRRLLQVGQETTEEPETSAVELQEQVHNFNTKAIGYGIFILILVFSVGGVYVMANMSFKQDTLLYSGAKMD